MLPPTAKVSPFSFFLLKSQPHLRSFGKKFLINQYGSDFPFLTLPPAGRTCSPAAGLGGGLPQLLTPPGLLPAAGSHPTPAHAPPQSTCIWQPREARGSLPGWPGVSGTCTAVSFAAAGSHFHPLPFTDVDLE